MFHWWNARRRAIARFPLLLGLFSITLVVVLGCSSIMGLLPNTATVAGASNVAYPQANRLAVGTNLSGIADWSTQLPFLDAFKYARSWLTQCQGGEVGCNGTWDTQETDKLDLDEHGWVKSLPKPEDPPQFTRVGTFLFNSMEQYPGGQYVVLYDGEGTIEYTFDAKKDTAASKPGRDVITVTPSHDGLFLQITATDPKKNGNYLRNIHAVPIAYESTFREQIFNPTFIERIQPFSALRFMDWMQTNNSQQRSWADRPQVEDASYAIKGVPIEIMVELANRMRAMPWFNMPHQANDEYISNFARLVKEKLDPKLKAYVEFSNEVWNWQFQQSHYALEQGKAKWGQDKGDAFAQWYGMRAAQTSDIWKQVFGNQRDRVVSVIGTQTGWQGLEVPMLDCPAWVAEGNKPCFQHGMDAYAITGYFSGNLGKPENQTLVESWFREPDGGFRKAFEQLGMKGTLGDSVGDTAKGFAYQMQVARDRGLKLVAYEGGQHIVGSQGLENNEKLTDFYIKVNQQPEMKTVYTEMLNQWKEAGGTLFMHFNDIGKPSKWGSWGALESVEQNQSPKYDALINFIQQNRLR
ncbi:MAG TPA: hypothetical protein V6D10_24170 [Trichocoleus sp.]|jgi:hypothetical protein